MIIHGLISEIKSLLPNVWAYIGGGGGGGGGFNMGFYGK